MHRHLPCGDPILEKENISGTLQGFSEAAKLDQPINRPNRGCAYIAADTWPPGQPPFCGAPRQCGSSYCPTHARLCTALPMSRAGRRIALEQALAARASPPMHDEVVITTPELLEPEPLEDAQRLHGLDLPHRNHNVRNEEPS
jgi:hypothetical protein